MEILRIDCGACRVKGPACNGCMMTALLGVGDEVGDGIVELAEDEQAALRSLAESGLLPPLRLVQSVTPPVIASDPDWRPESIEPFAFERRVL